MWHSKVSIQENELWDKEYNHSIGSWVPPAKGRNDGYAESRTASLYGRETYYEPRSFSPAPSQFGVHPPPGYQSGRNTPQSPFHPMAEITPLQTSSYQPISDADLERAVHWQDDVLRSAADLNSITKREIRRHIESHLEWIWRRVVRQLSMLPLTTFGSKLTLPYFTFFLLPYLNTLKYVISLEYTFTFLYMSLWYTQRHLHYLI